MELRVTFETGDPPTGHVTLVEAQGPLAKQPRPQGDHPIPFTGWLGLLRVLCDLLGHPDEP